MADEASLIAFSELVAQYPDLSMSIVADVLQACDQDTDRAYTMLCEMVIPPETQNSPASKPTQDTSQRTPMTKSPPRAPRAVRYAFDPPPTTQTDSVPTVCAAVPSPPMGAWAKKSMGCRYRVDEMCDRYPWASRKVVEALFEQYGECIELVETELLHMFPIDEPIAFNGGDGTDDAQRMRPKRGMANGTAKRQVIAESLRKQAADEIRRSGASDASISMTSRSMLTLRRELWEIRAERGRLLNLAAQTRKTAHVAEARKKDDELNRLSACLLQRIRESDEYRDGQIDLHGLTKDEAIQLVEWKLGDGNGKRFRVVTGKGIHSQNGQAVLRPALEKFFRARGVSCSRIEEGVMSVIP